jgi:mgtE-like transporter
MYATEIVKQSLPLLVICGLGAIIAGSTLGAMVEIIQNMPGLIVVIPAIIALRGNISTTLGSRLGSAYHLGIIDAENMWNDDLKQNIIGSLILSFSTSFIIGIFAYVTSILFNVQPDPFFLILVVVIAGVISGLILIFLTIIIIYLVFRQGYDPDNITGPALATFGDVVTMLCIFGSAVFVGGFI